MNSLMKRSNGNLPATSFSGLVDKVFQDNLSRLFEDEFWGFNGLSRSVNVPVNLRETDKTYEVELVAPGLKKEDFRINLSGDLVTVGFEQKQEQTEQNEGERWLRKEYRQQSFSRSFRVDESVDANAISAQYNDGILRLILPKKEGSQPLNRTIEIS